MGSVVVHVNMLDMSVVRVKSTWDSNENNLFRARLWHRSSAVFFVLFFRGKSEAILKYTSCSVMCI